MERSASVRRSRPLTYRSRLSPYPLRPYELDNAEEGNRGQKMTSMSVLEKRDWEDATCSVCMEFPHNAVLLLCSSHDRGCHPYMCGTSYRHSNCLDQFKKAYTKVHELEPVMGGDVIRPLSSDDKTEVMELAACPLCRGQVKGWTVVEPARKYLNNKKRSCMQDDCSFTGTYRELRKHVRSAHPSAKPREVDPTLQQKWRSLEHDREREDVLSTIRSSMPRSVFFGDYVIDMSNSDLDDSEEDEIVGGDGGGHHDMGRNILYLFLREGARFMRLHRDPHGTSPTNLEERYNDVADGDRAVAAAAAYFSGGEEDYIGTSLVLPPERQRRRRRRSRGRSVGGVS